MIICEWFSNFKVTLFSLILNLKNSGLGIQAFGIRCKNGHQLSLIVLSCPRFPRSLGISKKNKDLDKGRFG